MFGKSLAQDAIKKTGQAYREPVAEFVFDSVAESALLSTEKVQHDLCVKQSTKEHRPLEYLRCLDMCRVGNRVARGLEDM